MEEIGASVLTSRAAPSFACTSLIAFKTNTLGM